jgi:hypothetical protein
VGGRGDKIRICGKGAAEGDEREEIDGKVESDNLT